MQDEFLVIPEMDDIDGVIQSFQKSQIGYNIKNTTEVDKKKRRSLLWFI